MAVVGTGGGLPLRDILVCITSVAIRATEGATDIRIDRPESHAGHFRPVEHALRRLVVIPDVALRPDQLERRRFWWWRRSDQRQLHTRKADGRWRKGGTPRTTRRRDTEEKPKMQEAGNCP